MILILKLLGNALALLLTDYIVPGFEIQGFPTSLLAAIVLGVVNTFIKPILVILTLPLNILTLGLFTFVINAIMLWIVASIVPGMELGGLWDTILAAIVLSFVSTAISMFFRDLSSRRKR